MLAQVMAGGQISLAVGMTAMLLALFLGTLVGVLSGYFRRLDGPLMRLTDLFLALPLLPLLLVIIMLFRDTLRSAFGPETGIFILIVFVIGVTSWMHTARIVRGDVLAVKARNSSRQRKAAACGSTASFSGTSCRTCCPRSWYRNAWHCIRHHHGIGAQLPRPRFPIGLSDLGTPSL